MQFIATTHSPYVVGSAERGEVVVLRRDHDTVVADARGAADGQRRVQERRHPARVARSNVRALLLLLRSAHEATNYGQVEHYKPKGRAEFAHLAFSWENLLWACGRCNGPKSTQRNHSAPLLDPTVDEPNDHLRWHEAQLVHVTARGEYTITLLDLNGRKNLQRFELRCDHLEAARLILIAAQSGLDSAERTIARDLLRRWLGAGDAFRGMLSANGIALIELRPR